MKPYWGRVRITDTVWPQEGMQPIALLRSGLGTRIAIDSAGVTPFPCANNVVAPLAVGTVALGVRRTIARLFGREAVFHTVARCPVVIVACGEPSEMARDWPGFCCFVREHCGKGNPLEVAGHPWNLCECALWGSEQLPDARQVRDSLGLAWSLSAEGHVYWPVTGAGDYVPLSLVTTAARVVVAPLWLAMKLLRLRLHPSTAVVAPLRSGVGSPVVADWGFAVAREDAERVNALCDVFSSPGWRRLVHRWGWVYGAGEWPPELALPPYTTEMVRLPSEASDPPEWTGAFGRWYAETRRIWRQDGRKAPSCEEFEAIMTRFPVEGAVE